jgi:preprotein translocase subunit SecG
MMYSLLLAILILDGIFLCVVVLLQSGKGGGLAAMGGGAAATDGILGGRQATTMLTRATWTTGSVFMLLSLVLSIMSSRAQLPQSILRQDLAPVAQPILPTLAEPVEAPPGGDGND